MRRNLTPIALFAALAVAACGGGGGGGGYNPPGGGSTPPPNSSLPLQQTVAGGMAWVDAANSFTLYQLSADGNDSSHCAAVAGCTAIWPPLVPSTGSVATGNFAPFKRSDGMMQWAYNGHPLYTFAGDSGADQSNGNGLHQDGGVWTISRPQGAGGSTPPPGGGGGGCTGPYC